MPYVRHPPSSYLFELAQQAFELELLLPISDLPVMLEPEFLGHITKFLCAAKEKQPVNVRLGWTRGSCYVEGIWVIGAAWCVRSRRRAEWPTTPGGSRFSCSV